MNVELIKRRTNLLGKGINLSRSPEKRRSRELSSILVILLETFTTLSSRTLLEKGGTVVPHYSITGYTATGSNLVINGCQPQQRTMQIFNMHI